jgi:GTPase SAR1 family protein
LFPLKKSEKGEDKESKSRRVCRAGAGIEVTQGKGDTKGFPLRSEAAIVRDLRGFYRLELPRENRRTVQSSTWLVQGWRANSDIQILLYDCNPCTPDPEEIARVTDYIVAYQCKGNDSFQKERDEVKEYILNLKVEDSTGDPKRDSSKLAKQVMNRSLAHKMISKQESMVHLAGLDLHLCSETIEIVSISGCYRLTEDGGHVSKSNSIMKRYGSRQYNLPLSFDDYYDTLKNKVRGAKLVIPHYVGGKSLPMFPPTRDYARSVLLLYKPWVGTFVEEGRDFVKEFNDFIVLPTCPAKVSMPFHRIKQRVLTKSLHKEPTSQLQSVDYAQFSVEISEDAQDAVDIASTFPAGCDGNEDTLLDFKYDKGLQHDWSKQTVPVPPNASDWLEDTLKDTTFCAEDNKLGLPLRNDGSFYELESLQEDQRDIIAYCLKYLRNWIENMADEGTSSVKPLRLTVKGVAGSGKSTFINTLVTAIRRLFDRKESVVVCGPTGAAAFGAGGSTCHHTHLLPRVPEFGEISQTKLKKIRHNLDWIVALIIDERSMVSSGNLAMMEYHSRFGAYRGQHQNQLWGGIPLIIMVGDDFQLPSIDKGMIHIFDNYSPKTICENAGEKLFAEFAVNVMELKDTKRQHGDQAYLKELLAKVRAEEGEKQLTKKDAEFLCSYCIHDLRRFSESEANQLSEDPNTLFLFANKIPRDNHNNKMLFEEHSQSNPVATVKTKYTDSRGKQIGKPAHFKADERPETAQLCRNAKVQISKRNIEPCWGLYNGGMGIVKDIVFQEGHNPNFGDFPSYVLVHFPQYCGPPFLPEHPTWVPVTPVQSKCKSYCCTCTFIPLQLCYAKTVHTFQGQNAGPVQEGQQKNATIRIICDPGTKTFEGRNPGLFYTILSRITTLGDINDKMSSAIYFTGENMTPDRILNITKGANNQHFKRVNLRNQWVRLLNESVETSGMSESEIMEVLSWTKNTVIHLALYEKMTCHF